MHLVTSKAIVALALTGASIAGGLVLAGAGARLASADPTIVCDKDKACKQCIKGSDGGTICTACDQWGCGSNTAEVAGLPIGALHLVGLKNSAGFWIDPVLHKDNHEYDLRIEQGEIIGKGKAGKLTGQGLVGSFFMLHGPDLMIAGKPFRSWRVEIKNVAVVPLFAVRLPARRGKDTPYEYAFAYELELPELVDMRRQYVCPAVSTWGWEEHSAPRVVAGVGATPDVFPVLPWKKSSRYAVLVKGETYAPSTATVTPHTRDGTRWFNIACVGTALAKMKLLGYDPETTGRHATTWKQRQATLKMLTARYCKEQEKLSFTQTGQPLVWQNMRQWFPSPSPAKNPLPVLTVPAPKSSLPAATTPLGTTDDNVEAVWNQDGAICLNEPRRPEWSREEIIGACGVNIPRCDDYFRRPMTVQVPGAPKQQFGPPRRDFPPGTEWITRHSSAPPPAK
jgi:hypothetical protein